MSDDDQVMVGGFSGEIVANLPIRWARRPPPPGKAGVYIDGRETILQCAVLNHATGKVVWRDVPIVDLTSHGDA